MENYLKNIGIVLILFSGISCAPEEKDTSTSSRDSLLSNLYSISSDSVKTTVSEDEDSRFKEVPEIKIDLFRKRVLTLSDPFDPVVALTGLYQGDTVMDEWNNGSVIEIWKCGKCRQKGFEGTMLEDTLLFPSSQGNDTRLLSLYDLKDSSGNRYKIMATTTSEFSPYHERAGRDICGFLGLSLFQKKNAEWNLTSFNPALGCYGMFQTVETPLLVAQKSNYLLCITNRTGGPGGPYWGDLVIFGLYNNEFKELLKEKNTCKEGHVEGDGSWNTELKITEQGPNSIPKKIQLIISGEYEYDKFSIEDTISNLPDALRKTIRQDDRYHFVIRRNYVFKNRSYHFENETVSKKKKS